MRRGVGAALALLLLSACGGDDGAGSDDVVPTISAPVTTLAPLAADAPVRVPPLLVTAADLRPVDLRPVVEARPFDAREEPARMLLCQEDLRTDLGFVAGRQSRLTDGTVEVAHTVTVGGDTAAALSRFRTVVDGCGGPWTAPPLATGGGPVRREITAAYPLPDLGVEGAGAIVRSENDLGSTDTVVVMLVRGAVVSSLSVSGPTGSDLTVAGPAVEAAARRLLAAQSPAGP